MSLALRLLDGVEETGHFQGGHVYHFYAIDATP